MPFALLFFLVASLLCSSYKDYYNQVTNMASKRVVSEFVGLLVMRAIVQQYKYCTKTVQ